MLGDGLVDNRYSSSFGRRSTGDHSVSNELAPEEDSPLQSKISSMFWFDIIFTYKETVFKKMKTLLLIVFGGT